MWVRTMSSQPSGLIQVLLDEKAEFGDRHDAAMDLGAFDTEGAEEALARLACDEVADEDLADACGESLAEIWCRKGSITQAILVRLTPESLQTTLARLRVGSPSLTADAENILRSNDIAK